MAYSILTAKFVGVDSLGYQNGKTYDLILDQSKDIVIRRLDGTGMCPYQSLRAFLLNWEDIKVSK